MLPGIGVFGSGQLVRVLVPFLRSRGFKVEAIWAFTEETAQTVAQELQIAFWTNEIDKVLLLPSVHLIAIACPPHLHEQITTKACGIGKHVMCDWPPAMSSAEMISMLRAALNYPSLITILCNPLRFLPAVLQMKKLITDGSIGQIKIINVNVSGDYMDVQERYDGKCDELTGGGLLANIGTHIIDIITFMTNLRGKRVHAIMRNFQQSNSKIDGIRRITADDFTCFQMEMENNNCVANVTLNSNLFGPFRQEILVCGTNGYLILRDCDLLLRLSHSQSHSQSHTHPSEEVLLKDNENEQFENGLPLSAKNILPKPYRKGLYRMITSLRDAFQVNDSLSGDVSCAHWVKDAVKLAANFEDGQYIQATIEAIKSSSKNKEWIRINCQPVAIN